MTGAEIIALAKKRGVAVEVFFGKLRVHAESEPDESLVRLLRDNRQAIIDAFLEAETEPDRWRRLLAEKIETIVKMRGLPRPDAEAEAFRHIVIEYLNETHPNTDPRVCAHCRGPDLPLTPILAVWGRQSSCVASSALPRPMGRALAGPRRSRRSPRWGSRSRHRDDAGRTRAASDARRVEIAAASDADGSIPSSLCGGSAPGLTTQPLFHFCSRGSRDARGGAKPWLEGAHAVRRWLSREHEVHAAVRLSQAARIRFRFAESWLASRRA